LVSVMMPAYNAGRYIREAIESVLAQSFANWELLVVNDGSTDDTAQAAAQFDDRRIRLINKENGGEASARNVALDCARGEFLAYLDADDVYLPNHLAATIGFLDANPHFDAVYTDGFHIDENGRRLVTLQSRRRGPFEGRLYEEVVRASDVFGPPMCVVLRRAIVVRHRLRYDPRIVIGPDWDFFIRYADLATFGYIPERTGLYRVHQTNITVQVDAARRAGYLAICREKAVRMDSFETCSVETRVAVLYDLLVNLLRGERAKRLAITRWPAFRGLPAPEQARLLRLMATDDIQRTPQSPDAGDWLEQASALNPADRRATALAVLYGWNPELCAALVRTLRPRPQDVAPFADLEKAAREGERP
jgi:glycosyltransferase involved in cell wall biosynthesis